MVNVQRLFAKTNLKIPVCRGRGVEAAAPYKDTVVRKARCGGQETGRPAFLFSGHTSKIPIPKLQKMCYTVFIYYVKEGITMYKPGDDKLEVRELLVKAFASAWEVGDKTVDRDTYINSSINVIDSLQVGPEMIYGEEGQGLLDAELDHLPDLLRADGAWVYYAVPAENYFILTWMEDAEKAAAKVDSLKDEDDSLACIVDLTQEWTHTEE